VRIGYRIHYQGPGFEVLQPGDYRLEELWDHGASGSSLKVVVTAPDGTLLRGFAQHGDRRRVLLATPVGAFDLRFRLADPAGRLFETRRRQLAEALFSTLIRAAAPERLTHLEREDSHVVELGPPMAGGPTALPGVLELDSARIVVDKASYRLESLSLGGRLLGEPFGLDAAASRSWRATLPGRSVPRLRAARPGARHGHRGRRIPAAAGGWAAVGPRRAGAANRPAVSPREAPRVP